MFDSFKAKEFGKRIKKMRVDLGHSQTDVSQATGISIDTLRKMENGYALPRYETLSHLSQFYKTDILYMFSKYQQSSLLFEFLRTLDSLMMRGKFKDIENSHEDFLLKLNQSEDLQLVSLTNLQQIDLFLQAISLRYKNEHQLALDNICFALKLTNPLFVLENFDDLKYTKFETRMLLVAGNCLGDLRSCELSNRIFEYILKVTRYDIYSDKTDDLFVLKSLSSISYNYHRLDNHPLALEYAQRGIQLSLEKGHIDMLHFLFLREAVAKYRLNDPTYVNSFKKSLYVIKITNEEEHFQHMLTIIKDKYHLDFSDI